MADLTFNDDDFENCQLEILDEFAMGNDVGLENAYDWYGESYDKETIKRAWESAVWTVNNCDYANRNKEDE